MSQQGFGGICVPQHPDRSPNPGEALQVSQGGTSLDSS